MSYKKRARQEQPKRAQGGGLGALFAAGDELVKLGLHRGDPPELHVQRSFEVEE